MNDDPFSFEDLVPKDDTLTSVDAIVELYGKGHDTKEVQTILEGRGAVVRTDFLEEIRQRYSQAILEIYYANSKELMRKISRSNKFIRIKNINTILEKMESLINQALESGDLSPTVIKAFDAMLKGNRLIAEETNDLQPIQKSINNTMVMISSMPPEERKALSAKITEIKRLVGSGAGQSIGQDDVIDTPFVAEEEGNNEAPECQT